MTGSFRFNVELWRLVLSLAFTLVLCLHMWKVYPLPFLTALENLAYDVRLGYSLGQGVDGRVVVVAIDDQSLQEVGRWPWSRNHLARLFTILFDHYRVAALAVDVVFPEPDHSSGLHMLERLADGDLKNDPEFQASMAHYRSSLAYDHLLAQAMRGKPVVLGYLFNNDTQRPVDPRQQLPKPILDLWETGNTNTNVPRASNFIGNLEILQHAAMSGGFFSNAMLDPDGVTRRMSLVHRYQDGLYTSLALATIRALLGNPATTIGFANVTAPLLQPLVPRWIDVGNYRIPLDEEGAVLVPFRGPQGSFRHIPAVDILNKRLPPSSLTGNVVLLGATATGMGDRVAVPFQKDFPGVETHANLISAILDGRIKEHSQRLIWLDSAILLSCAALMAMVGGYSWWWNPLFMVLLSALSLMVQWLAWEKVNLALSPGLTEVAILAIFAINLLLRNASGEKTTNPVPEDSPALPDPAPASHVETESFWDDPPDAWRMDTSKMVVRASEPEWSSDLEAKKSPSPSLDGKKFL